MVARLAFSEGADGARARAFFFPCVLINCPTGAGKASAIETMTPLQIVPKCHGCREQKKDAETNAKTGDHI